ncbi:MAG: glycosyltransferase family 4 protein [Cyanobacteria bacterium P01_A01_bin.135]
MTHPLRVGFLSLQNYLDKNTFSGTLYHMYHALQAKGVELVDLKKPEKPTLLSKAAGRVVGKLRDPVQQDAATTAKFKRQVEASLANQGCDVIFAPVASKEVNLIDTSVPIVFSSDATPALIHNDYYKIYGSEAEFNAAAQAEKRVVAKANRLVYPSQWAADSAIEDYGAEQQQVTIVPFGANVDSVPAPDYIYGRLGASRCRLLFVGKDWQRKGGNLAFDTLLALVELGVDAELTMIGCLPPDEAIAQVEESRLTVIPFLNKNVPQERDRLHQIFLDAHFFLFPTRADCSPIVLCESAAFGLPVMSSHVGGIPTIVETGVNGYTFPLEAGGDQYAKQIADLFSDAARYKQLVLSSRQAYDQRLNWSAWAEQVVAVLQKAAA